MSQETKGLPSLKEIALIFCEASRGSVVLLERAFGASHDLALEACERLVEMKVLGEWVIIEGYYPLLMSEETIEKLFSEE